MQLKMHISGGADDSLEDLHDWLQMESAFRGLVALEYQESQPNHLGPVADALMVSLGGGGALAVLAASLRAWFAQPKRSDIRIVIRSVDGTSIEIDAKRINDAESLLTTALSGRQ